MPTQNSTRVRDTDISYDMADTALHEIQREISLSLGTSNVFSLVNLNWKYNYNILLYNHINLIDARLVRVRSSTLSVRIPCVEAYV